MFCMSLCVCCGCNGEPPSRRHLLRLTHSRAFASPTHRGGRRLQQVGLLCPHAPPLVGPSSPPPRHWGPCHGAAFPAPAEVGPH